MKRTRDTISWKYAHLPKAGKLNRFSIPKIIDGHLGAKSWKMIDDNDTDRKITGISVRPSSLPVNLSIYIYVQL